MYNELPFVCADPTRLNPAINKVVVNACRKRQANDTTDEKRRLKRYPSRDIMMMTKRLNNRSEDETTPNVESYQEELNDSTSYL